MTLKEKFESIEPNHVNHYEGLIEIADEFAIGFAEWLLWQDITSRGKNNFVCADGVQRNTKQLLEIYKIEKGL
jgi:hypothetical protein